MHTAVYVSIVVVILNDPAIAGERLGLHSPIRRVRCHTYTRDHAQRSSAIIVESPTTIYYCQPASLSQINYVNRLIAIHVFNTSDAVHVYYMYFQFNITNKIKMKGLNSLCA